jgi:ribosomal RNA-processing protein 36
MQPDLSSEDEDPSTSLNDISFGALAKAQESFAPPPRPGKRKRTFDREANSPPPSQSSDAAPHPPAKFFKPSHHRTSKHAPQTLSTRHAVSRKRTIFAPSPALKSRDPRFDPQTLHPGLSLEAEAEKANKNYAFLTAYRQSELQSLQTQLKAAQAPPPPPPSNRKKKPKPSTTTTASPSTIATFKREIMSLTSKLATSATKSREREILRAHRQKEREAIRDGRKSQPYYLKRGEVKKEIEREKTEGMGKRARLKREMRREKREKGREGRDLPRVRRGV